MAESENTESERREAERLLIGIGNPPVGGNLSGVVELEGMGPGVSAELLNTSKVITARGTEEGLVLRIDGRAEWDEIVSEIRQFLGTRRRFLEGGQVSVEWLERLPTKEQSSALETLLTGEYGIEITSRRKRPQHTVILERINGDRINSAGGEKTDRPGERSQAERDRLGDISASQLDSDFSSGSSSSTSSRQSSIPTFSEPGAYDRSSFDRAGERRRGESQIGGIGPASVGGNHSSDSSFLSAPEVGRQHSRKGTRQDRSIDSALLSTAGLSMSIGEGSDSQRGYVSNVAKLLGEELQYEEDANAKIFFGTLRSGQRIETPFSLIVVGDINPGADLAAGGDIVVLGSLRGTAHAAAYDDDCQDRVIIALQMQPMQLRIGSVISRGSGEPGAHVEIARVENRRIVVETFQPRGLPQRKSR